MKRGWWMPYDKPVYPDMSVNIGSVDLAFTSKKENDFSAMTCWGVWRDSGETSAVVTRDIAGRITREVKSEKDADVPKIIMTYAWAERLEFHELIEKIITTARENKLDILLIENKGPGISVAQEIKRLCGMEEFQVRLVDPGDLDKVARLHSVVHLFSEGLVYAPTKAGDPDTWRVWADRVITEVESFPKGVHDDLVDTVSQAISYMRKHGMIERGVERSFELAESQKFMGNTGNVPLYPV